MRGFEKREEKFREKEIVQSLRKVERIATTFPASHNELNKESKCGFSHNLSGNLGSKFSQAGSLLQDDRWWEEEAGVGNLLRKPFFSTKHAVFEEGEGERGRETQL